MRHARVICTTPVSLLLALRPPYLRIFFLTHHVPQKSSTCCVATKRYARTQAEQCDGDLPFYRKSDTGGPFSVPYFQQIGKKGDFIASELKSFTE